MSPAEMGDPVTGEDVRHEREQSVDRPAHWAYLGIVLGGASVAMLVLMAVLDALPA